MIYVYTSILNGFDNLRPPAAPPEDGVRYICFTDVPNLPRVYPWEYRPIFAAGDASRTSRIPKILPYLMLPADADYSIWHDGNFVLKLSPWQTISDTLRASGGPYEWAAYKHPCRRCIYREAAVLLEDPSMAGWREQKPERAVTIAAEIARYRAAGYPADHGLWANGFIVRKHTRKVDELCEKWWTLYAAGGERDQLSFPVAQTDSGVAVNTLQGDVYGSPFVQFRWHAAFREREDNPDFWPQRDAVRARLARLRELTGNESVTYAEY
jgi:hypothetical protein